MKFTFTLIILITTSFQIYAQDKCKKSNVDLTNLPQYNDQNELKWCFAYTAADLLSFYEKNALSSYDIALKYHAQVYTVSSNSKKKTQIGGSPSRALSLMNKDQKLCLEKETDLTDGDWTKLSQLIDDLNDEAADLEEIICHHFSKNNAFYKTLSIDVFHVLNKLPKNELLPEIFKLACHSNYTLKNAYQVHTQKLEDFSSAELIQQIDESLNTDEPVSIGYDIDALLKLPEAESKPYLHASTIIGRRLNPISLECEYFIRNSWGQDSCPKKNKFIDCTDGNFWISQKKLKENVFEVTSLKIKK